MGVADLFRETAGRSLPDAAGRYAAAGVAVFPCVVGGKRPLTAHGFHDASTDPGRTEQWWSRWPAANIGLPTGPVSGVGVVDVDVHPTGSGFAAFERARRAGLVDGWAVLVRTPSGGVHAYYPADPDRPHASWQAPRAHVDFRGAGGYIIAPPSVIATGRDSGSGYELIAATTTIPSPVNAEALRELLDPRPEPAPVNCCAAERGVDVERLTRWVAARGAGERNRGLFWAACRLAETGLPPGDAHTALADAAGHAGLPRPEVTATIRSAYRTTGASPHTPSTADDWRRVEAPGQVSRLSGQAL